MLIVALAIGLALGIQAFLVKPYQIPSPSMEPTLDVGQRVLVNRLSYRLGGDPDVGDIVVFHPPEGAVAAGGQQCGVGRPERKPGQACPEPTSQEADTNFIKRVVALPGDQLSIKNGIPIVNGEPVTGDWEIRPCRGIGGCDFPKEITIPPDHYFMMGDNRGASDDSRYWGPVPRDWLIGTAFATYWPPDRIGLF
ncbi:MAG: signal peptidase I [Solirubrobacterales bacterium]